jgi:hypothetical protein
LTLVSRAEFLRRSAALAGLALVPELAAACGGSNKSALDRATRFESHPAITCPIVW